MKELLIVDTNMIARFLFLGPVFSCETDHHSHKDAVMTLL
jgi:hypothetical protein